MRKRVFEHMRTAKAQIRAVWSGPSLSAYKIIGSYKFIKGEQRSGWYFAHARNDLYLLILRMCKGTVSLDTVDMIMETTEDADWQQWWLDSKFCCICNTIWKYVAKH